MKYDSFNKAVGDYLLEYRQKHNLTQQQMADMIGNTGFDKAIFYNQKQRYIKHFRAT